MKLIFLALISLFSCAAMAQHGDHGHNHEMLEVTGYIQGAKDSAEVVIYSTINQSLIARAYIKNERFFLKGDLHQPTQVGFVITAENLGKFLFVGNEKINITGSVKDWKNLKVTNSRTHDDFEVFIKTFDPYLQKFSKLKARMNEIGETDSTKKAYAANDVKFQKEVDKFLSQKPASPVSAFLLLLIDQSIATRHNKLDKRFKSLKEGAMDNAYYAYLKDQIESRSVGAIGSRAMEFSQADTTGKMVSLSSFKGKYVLLDFWASWCGPCRNENPNVVAAYQKFKDKNFTVLGVSLDQPGMRDAWIEAIHEDNLTWTNVSDLQFWNNAVAKMYKVAGIPQNFLIGPDGTILAKNLRGPALEAELCKHLGCK